MRTTLLLSAALLLTGCDNRLAKQADQEAADTKLDLIILSQSNIVVRTQIILDNQHKIYHALTNHSNAMSEWIRPVSGY